jgi:hypothetical protein
MHGKGEGIRLFIDEQPALVSRERDEGGCIAGIREIGIRWFDKDHITDPEYLGKV